MAIEIRFHGFVSYFYSSVCVSGSALKRKMMEISFEAKTSFPFESKSLMGNHSKFNHLPSIITIILSEIDKNPLMRNITRALGADRMGWALDDLAKWIK